jgi:hypothetical protein
VKWEAKEIEALTPDHNSEYPVFSLQSDKRALSNCHCALGSHCLDRSIRAAIVPDKGLEPLTTRLRVLRSTD